MQIIYHATIDQLYNVMNEGDRIHMVNKLHKHGYVGSRNGDGSLGGQSLERIVSDLKAYGITASDVVKMYEKVDSKPIS